MLTRTIILCFFLVINCQTFGQNEIKFDSKDKYIQYLNENFNIEKSTLYYLSSEKDGILAESISPLIFIKDDNITNIEKVSGVKSIRSIKKYFQNLTEADISNSFSKNQLLSNLKIKSLTTDADFAKEGKLLALFLYSYKMGKEGLLYIKHLKELEHLKIDVLIITLDGNELPDAKFQTSPIEVIKT